MPSWLAVSEILLRNNRSSVAATTLRVTPGTLLHLAGVGNTFYSLVVGYPNLMFEIRRFDKMFSEVGEGLWRTKTALSYFVPFLRPRKRGLFLALVLLLLET